MALITYADKDKDATDGIKNEWRDIDANEVKNVVNANAVAGGSTLDQLTVSTAGGTITLDFASKAERMFLGSATIAAIKTWALANTTGALKIASFIFTVSGLYAQTMPSNFKMSDARWDSVGKTWTPLDTGTYNAVAVFDGTSWLLSIEQNSGPFT